MDDDDDDDDIDIDIDLKDFVNCCFVNCKDWCGLDINTSYSH